MNDVRCVQEGPVGADMRVIGLVSGYTSCGDRSAASALLLSSKWDRIVHQFGFGCLLQAIQQVTLWLHIAQVQAELI